MKKFLTILLGLLLAGSLGFPTGCGGKGKSKTAPGPAAEKTAAAAAEAPEVISETVVSYEFRSEGKRDPFLPFVTEETTGEAGQTPLEKFDLYQLKITGIMARKVEKGNGIITWTSPESRATIGAPDGQVYIVQVGTPIGRHLGRVVEIGQNCIMIEERFKDFYGKAQERKSPICFPEEKK